MSIDHQDELCSFLLQSSVLSNNAKKVSLGRSLKMSCLKVLAELDFKSSERASTYYLPLNNWDNEQDNSEKNKDFSGSDNGDEFVPNSKKKRKRLSSNSSNAITSSSSSNFSSCPSPSSSSGSTSSSSSSATIKKEKKRSQNVATWKKNKAKLLKNSGKRYVSHRTGNIVKAKEMKPPCSYKCRLSCSTKLTTQERQMLFDNYWALSSLQRQRDYLSTCVTILQVSVRRLKANTTKERRPNCCFSFLMNGKTIRVCKTFLINTLAIGEKTLRTVVEAKSSGSGVIPEDRRGKHSKRKQDPEVTQSVRDHINSIPRVESHYIKANTSREFIDGGLTIAEMYRHYKTQRESLIKPAAKYGYYAKIFNTEFNISLFVPKKDQYDVCEAYKNAVDQEKQALEEGFKEHQKQKQLSRKEKKEFN